MQTLQGESSATTVSAVQASRDVAPNGVVNLSYFELLTLLMCLASVIVVSQKLQMNIEKQLTVASLRCFIQLSALGLVLVPIILWNAPILVVSYIVFMMFIAAIEASSRPPYVFDSILLVCFVAIAGTVAVFGAFTFTVVLKTGFDAQYAIPITGMITGTSLSAVSVAVSNIVTTIAERKESIELLLAFGATRWEAGLDSIRSSVILGLTPTLNLLSITGLVSIPGMMTGQIIGGTPPALAAKYQLVIMYVAAGSATIATVFASILTLYMLVDSQHRIRLEELTPRENVNRLDAVIGSARYLSTRFLSWRQRVDHQGSPFPCYTNDSLPLTNSGDPLTKTGSHNLSHYRAISGARKDDSADL